MKNVYNLISQAFDRLGHQQHRESDYNVTVVFTDTVFPSYEITIQPRDSSVQGSAFLHLMLNREGDLINYDETNDLFINQNWDRFCGIFEEQLVDIRQAFLEILNAI
jgi:hypothetical protein